jgi:hypothetical protein
MPPLLLRFLKYAATATATVRRLAAAHQPGADRTLVLEVLMMNTPKAQMATRVSTSVTTCARSRSSATFDSLPKLAGGSKCLHRGRQGERAVSIAAVQLYEVPKDEPAR